jgi:O-antigen/teichoic acid export membrane protein
MRSSPDSAAAPSESQDGRPSRRGIAALGSATVLSQVVIGLTSVIAARALGPEGRGIVSAVLVWAQTLPYFAMAGMNSSLTVRVAEDPRAMTGLAVGNALAYSLLAGVVFLVPTLIIVPSTLAPLGRHADELVVIGLLLLPVGILTELFFAILISLGRIRQYNLARLTGPLVTLGGTVFLALIGSITPSAIVLLTLAGGLVTVATLGLGVPWSGLRLGTRELVHDVVFGLKASIAGWANLVNLRFDMLLLSTFAAASQIGFYGVANNATLPIATLAAVAAGMLTPAVARLGTDARAQILMIKRELARYAGISVVAAVLLAVATPVLIPLLFGAGFEPAVVLVWILIPGYVARVWTGMVTAGAIGMRRPGVGNMIEGCSLVVTLALLPFLLPRYEATGAAITSTAAYFVGGLAAAWALRNLGRRQPDPAPSVPPVVVAAAAAQKLPE